MEKEISQELAKNHVQQAIFVRLLTDATLCLEAS
jgi:hypothetical protein